MAAIAIEVVSATYRQEFPTRKHRAYRFGRAFSRMRTAFAKA
jgi:hypothetical protein